MVCVKVRSRLGMSATQLSWDTTVNRFACVSVGFSSHICSLFPSTEYQVGTYYRYYTQVTNAAQISAIR